MEILKQRAQIDAPHVAEFLKLYSCEDDTILLADWSGVLDATRARKGCPAMLDILRDRPYTKILNNNTKVTGHFPGALDWLVKVWFPSLYELGVQHFAWVYSLDFYTQIATDEVAKLSSTVKIQTFFQVSDAREWLLSKP